MISEEEKVMKLIDKVMSLEEKVSKMAGLNAKIGEHTTKAIEELNNELHTVGKSLLVLNQRVKELEDELEITSSKESKT